VKTRDVSELARPTWLPASASLVLIDQVPGGYRGEARADGRVLAQLAWSAEGLVSYEKTFDAAGMPHGVEIEYADDGRVRWCACWAAGEMHGPAVQLDEHELPVLASWFVHGRGVDIWMSCGRVSEVREVVNGVRHGLERWGDPERPYEEGSFRNGLRHGVFRCWDESGVLSGTYPQYFINDEAVSAVDYLRAQANGSDLPPYEVRDDCNVRQMPASVEEALRLGSRMRAAFSLSTFVHCARRGELIPGWSTSSP
jgi:hypothetical protein